MSKKEFNILVDLDGVVANFAKMFSIMAREIYGESMPLILNESEIMFWHWEKWYPITEEQILNVWEHIRKRLNFWTQLELLNEEEWQYFVKNMLYQEHLNVYFITAREPTIGMTVANQSAVWLQKKGWPRPFVIQNRQKEKLVKELDIKFVIDDKDKNLIKIKKENPDCIVHAYDVPHNKKKLQESGIEYKTSNLKIFTDDVLEFLKTA